MYIKLSLVLVLASTCVSSFAFAQQASPPDTDLRIQRMQRRPVVLPKPSPEQIQADANAAVSSYENRATTGSVLDQATRVNPPPRPDLGYDVTTGIQQRRILDALPGPR
jgi:hypothetical protein